MAKKVENAVSTVGWRAFPGKSAKIPELPDASPGSAPIFLYYGNRKMVETREN